MRHVVPTRLPIVICQHPDKLVEDILICRKTPSYQFADIQDKAYHVVSWDPDWLVGGKVSEEDPIPGGDQHIFSLDVAVAHAALVALGHSMKQLEGDPVLQEAVQSAGSGVDQ